MASSATWQRLVLARPDASWYIQRAAPDKPWQARTPRIATEGIYQARLRSLRRQAADWLKSKDMPVKYVQTPGVHSWIVWQDNLIHFAPLLFQP